MGHSRQVKWLKMFYSYLSDGSVPCFSSCYGQCLLALAGRRWQQHVAAQTLPFQQDLAQRFALLAKSHAQDATELFNDRWLLKGVLLLSSLAGCCLPRSCSCVVTRWINSALANGKLIIF